MKNDWLSFRGIVEAFPGIQNRTKSGNLAKIVRFSIRTKPGIVLIKFILSGDFLYSNHA